MPVSGFLDRKFAETTFFDDPYRNYAELQQDASAHWSETWNAWVLTRYDDVQAALKNTAQFSSAGRHSRMIQQLPESEQTRVEPLRQHYALGGIINSDPPNHTRLRKLVNKAFTPRAINRLRPRIQQIVDDLLKAAMMRREVDLIRDFAYPLPAVVIAEMLGAQAEDRDRFKEWSENINAFLGTGQPQLDYALRSQTSLQDMKAYISHLLVLRRQAPQDDLLTNLAQVEDEEGDTLSEDELLATAVTLLIAGHETTTNLIGNGMLALLGHPEAHERLRQEPARLPGAIEEMLRYDGPVHSLKRVTVEDASIGDSHIKAGSLVYLVLGAANRDPAQFTRPHSFDVRREAGELRHIAFGYGIHFCVGAPLARLEGEIAIRTLLKRTTDIQLTGAPVWKRNMSVRGLAALPVALDGNTS